MPFCSCVRKTDKSGMGLELSGALISSCLRQVPPPSQPSVVGGDSSKYDSYDDGGVDDADDDDDDDDDYDDGYDDDCDGDGDEEGEAEEEAEEEEGCHMWRVSFLPW